MRLHEILIAIVDFLALRDLCDADTPPVTVAMDHRLRHDLAVDECRDLLLLGILDGLAAEGGLRFGSS